MAVCRSRALCANVSTRSPSPTYEPPDSTQARAFAIPTEPILFLLNTKTSAATPTLDAAVEEIWEQPWDYLKLVAKVPGEQAFTTLADSKCAMVKK